MANTLDPPLKSHTLHGIMKMTMHIDESLLDRVMNLYGCTSKTEAVDFALRELDRLHRLRTFAENGLGFTSEELKHSVYPDYDVLATRNDESMRVAENAESYDTAGDEKRDSHR